MTSAKPPTGSKTTFVCLSVLGLLTLFGSLAVNGGLKQILLTMWTGKFSDGSTLHTVYTGIPFLDFLLSLTPTFWTPALNRPSALKLLSVSLYSALQSLATWATIEVFRRGNKPLLLRWAPAFVCLWMYAGTALFIPFYCFYDLSRHFGSSSSSSSSRNFDKPSDPGVAYLHALCILPAAVVCYIWPYYMMHFPPSGMTSSQHQTLLAFNIFGSVFCYLLVLGAGNNFSPTSSPRAAQRVAGSRTALLSDVFWIKATYATMAVYSFTAQVSVLASILRSPDANVSFSAVFMPDFVTGMSGSPASLKLQMAPEIHFFLQWDFLIFVFATSVWATRIWEGLYCGSKEGWTASTRAGLVLAFGMAGILLNPGAVLSGLLYVREDFIRARYASCNTESKELATRATSS